MKMGRQDIKLGAGRIFLNGTGLNGTGGDASSSHFDAFRGAWNYGKKSTVETIILYIGEDDWLPSLGDTKNADGVRGDYDTTGFGGNNEFGARRYWQHREKGDLPFDGYAIYKRETTGSKIMGRDLYTVGFRLMPQFTEVVSGEVEVAAQTGQRDDGEQINGAMVYGGVSWALQQVTSPTVTLACLYLSGGNDNTGWNPVFNRDAWIGEVPASMYSAYRYTNLVYLHLALEMTPIVDHALAMETGPMYTAIDEEIAGGCYKGFYSKVKYTFPIMEDLQGAIILEYLIKGDYYERNSRSDAWFSRFELTMTF